MQRPVFGYSSFLMDTSNTECNEIKSVPPVLLSIWKTFCVFFYIFLTFFLDANDVLSFLFQSVSLIICSFQLSFIHHTDYDLLPSVFADKQEIPATVFAF